ncbi:MAG TPA: YlqD family protein [Candidatus Gastranaerophilales bacterium]|nr:YlqD family protein [Candidatus Gastranaerophilales bacterium]
MGNKMIRVKRPVKVKTIVTDGFKHQAKEELSKEIRLVENQIMQLELQGKQIQDQISGASALYYGEQNLEQIQVSLDEIIRRLQQMGELKQELQFQQENIEHLALDNVIITGSLENYVELRPGENLYEKFKDAEIIVKDGVIQDIVV